jgi:uncharacterized protein
MDIKFIIAYLVVGIISGLFTGSVGVGSGVILVPLLTQLGMSLSQSIATGLILQLVPQSIFGVIEYYNAGDIVWKNSLIVLIGSSIGIYFGAMINTKKWISNKYLYLILSITLFTSSIYIFITHVVYHSTQILIQ